jgi:rubredoxin
MRHYFPPAGGKCVPAVYCASRAWQTTPLFCFKSVSIVSDEGFKVWMCIICGWIYDEEKGAPEEGLKPGMRWEDVPDYWVCPDCGAGKEDFEMIEV